MGRLVKCYYSNCGLGKVDKDEGINYKGKNYHKECYAQVQLLHNIRDLCFQIDPTVVFKSLNGYLNKLIYEKQIDIDYILFTLEYIIKHNLDINLPYGLSYKLNDYRIKTAYTAVNATQIKIHSS
jgi:hypothetical protein